MSRSPHRLRGDAAEAWRMLLYGEVLRALEASMLAGLTVQDGPTVKLPRSGRWQTGLSALRPALDDDVLGHTALAVAWRWACAQVGANAWPSVALVASKAVDAPFRQATQKPLAVSAGCVIDEAPGEGRMWQLLLDTPATLRVWTEREVDFTEVDRVANIAAAWLDAPFVTQTMRRPEPAGDRAADSFAAR